MAAPLEVHTTQRALPPHPFDVEHEMRSRNDRALLAERHLVHRALLASALSIPIGAAFFALLVLVAVRLSSVPAGAPVAMGAGVGVLAGLFFGMWVGVVASVDELEHVEHDHGPSD